MTQRTMDDAVTDWVIDYPKTEAVFQHLGIDYSCGGKSLKYACLQLGLDPQHVLSVLRDSIEQSHHNGTAPG
jgi:iron-sulfur cluster repair protein YtfE (RIC family)